MTAATGALAPRLHRFARRHDIPAVGAALIGTDGPPHIEVVGTRLRGGTEPVSCDDAWHIGSCAKAMTAALLARYIERGAVVWETPVAELFPDVDAAPGWREVTLTQMLSHRSGLPANLSLRRMRAAFDDTRDLVTQRTDVTATALATGPSHAGRFRYSNLGYVIAGAAVDRLAGCAYEKAIADELFNPLGIARFGLGAPVGDHPRGHGPRFLAVGKGPAIDPTEMALPRPADNPPVLNSAGRLHFPLADWAKFVRLFLLPGTGFLEDVTIRTLLTPVGDGRTRQAMGWAEARSPVIGLAQQGSNRRWVATAALTEDRRRAVLVTANDGRTLILMRSASLAADLLEAARRSGPSTPPTGAA